MRNTTFHYCRKIFGGFFVLSFVGMISSVVHKDKKFAIWFGSAVIISFILLVFVGFLLRNGEKKISSKTFNPGLKAE